jgi:hypothetical protein
MTEIKHDNTPNAASLRPLAQTPTPEEQGSPTEYMARASDLLAGLPSGDRRAHGRTVQLQRQIGNRAMLNLLQRTASAARRPVITPNTQPASIQRDFIRDGQTGGVYESEQFGGGESKRERPTYVEVPVRHTTTGDRGAAPAPLSQFAHGGKIEGTAAARKAGFDGGHIVGLHIGGEDIPENVVPMFKAFNRGAYKRMEDTVKKKSDELQKLGRGAWITVHCHYEDAGETPDIPYAFDIMMESVNPEDGSRTACYTEFLRQPEDIKLVAQLNEDEQKMVRGEVDAADIRKAASSKLDEFASLFELGIYKSVEEYVKATNHLPTSKKGLYPDFVTLRPYEFLDMLYFANKLDAGTELNSFREFTARQRELILQANMARNGGVLKSDDPADTVNGGILSEQGDLNFPEIDHIVPKSKGGSNFFSNARVVSWQLNNKDDRVKSLLGVVDLSKRALPPLTGMGKNDLPALVEHYLSSVAVDTIFSANQVWTWGTQKFTVMSGATLTPRRLGVLKSSLVKYVNSGYLAHADSKYKRVK